MTSLKLFALLFCISVCGAEIQIGDESCPTLQSCTNCICDNLAEGCAISDKMFATCREGLLPVEKATADLCNLDPQCSTACVQNFLLAKASDECTGSIEPANITCSAFAGLYKAKGLARKCNKKAAKKFGEQVGTCCGNFGNGECSTLTACSECICKTESGYDKPLECDFDLNVFKACKTGPTKIKRSFKSCLKNAKCQQTCMNNFLSQRSTACYEMEAADVSCDELGRLYKSGPNACPGKKFQPFGKGVANCCSGKLFG